MIEGPFLSTSLTLACGDIINVEVKVFWVVKPHSDAITYNVSEGHAASHFTLKMEAVGWDSMVWYDTLGYQRFEGPCCFLVPKHGDRNVVWYVINVSEGRACCFHLHRDHQDSIMVWYGTTVSEDLTVSIFRLKREAQTFPKTLLPPSSG
jgi:hypothetical protein